MTDPARFSVGNSPAAHMVLLSRAPERVLALRLAMSSAVGPSSVVLDAGCGSLGVLAIMAARLGARRVVAVDHGRLDAARALAEENGVADRIEFRQCDLADLPADSGSFDVILGMIYYNEPRPRLPPGPRPHRHRGRTARHHGLAPGTQGRRPAHPGHRDHPPPHPAPRRPARRHRQPAHRRRLGRRHPPHHPPQLTQGTGTAHNDKPPVCQRPSAASLTADYAQNLLIGALVRTYNPHRGDPRSGDRSVILLNLMSGSSRYGKIPPLARSRPARLSDGTTDLGGHSAPSAG